MPLFAPRQKIGASIHSLHGLRDAVRLPGIDGLAGLLDLLEHAGVLDGGFGRDVGGLGVEGNVVGFHAWMRGGGLVIGALRADEERECVAGGSKWGRRR